MSIRPMTSIAVAVAAAVAACGGTPKSTTTPAPLPAAAPATAAVPAAPAAAPLPAPPPPAIKLRSLEGIDEYVLGNGLRVLVFPDPTQSTVTVNITYFVGSKHEGYGETGMAHLLEHMLFKGTPRHRNVLKLIDERGGFANGSTWTDRTNYFETLPAAGDNLRWALDLEADRMRNASISADDLSTEFSVVRNELEAGENNPRGVLEERMVSTAYLWHNYGKSTIGSRSDVEGVGVVRLRPFYDTYYQPDNAILVVAGKFDPATALRDVEATFGVIARPARTLPLAYTIEPVQDGERTVVLRRTGDVHLISALYHAVAGADADHVAFDALEYVLTDTPSGRLYRELVKTGLAAEVWGAHYLWRDPGFLVITAKAKDGKTAPRVKDALVRVSESFARSPVTAEEIERFKNAQLKDLTLLINNSQRVSIELSEWAATGDWRLLFAYRDRVKALTAADVQRVALAYLKSSNRTLGEFIPTTAPDRAPVAPTPDIAAAVDQVGVGDTAAGEEFVASLDNLAARTTFSQVAGGLQAAYLPKKTRGGSVVVALRFRHGDATSLAGKQAIARLTAAVAARGTKTRSFSAIEDAKDQATARVRLTGTPGGVWVRIETVRASLPQVLDLVADMVKNPAFAAAELDVARREQISDLEEARQDPTQLGFNLMERLVSPWPKGDPRAVSTIDDQITALRAVKPTDLRAYHQAFWGNGRGEVVAVGDFDPAQLTAELEKHFGTWKSKAAYARLADKTFGVAGSDQTIDTKDKEMALVAAMHDLAIKDDHADAPALAIASRIFGGSSGSRLWMRLREKEGYSYGVWGFLVTGDEDPAGQAGFGAILAPANLSKAKAALLEETERLVTAGVTAAEVEVAKKAWLEEQDNLLADDDSLTDVLVRGRYLGRDLTWHRDLRAKIARLTAEDVNRAIKAWVQPRRLTVISAGDLSKAK